MTALEPITALLPAEQVEALRALAESHDRSVSAEIRRAVKAHVEGHAAEAAA